MVAVVASATMITRRRALNIVASGAAALLAGKRLHAAAEPCVWQGTALGAPARLILCGVAATEISATVRACLDEVERLEREFTLYRPESAVSRLNRQGYLDRPSLDLSNLLTLSTRFSELTAGAFDITVQPLWQAYADHFAGDPGSADGPSETALANARARIGFRRIRADPERITLEEGMAVTLNGIAQGYITDRVASLLRARGFSRVLVDMGEIRALEGQADGSPWSVGIEVPPGINRAPFRLAISDGAVATSAGYATAFEPTGRSHHLFSPQTGRSAGSFAAVTVTAPYATLADALSTALYVLPPQRIPFIARQFTGVGVYLNHASGEVQQIAAT